MFLLSDRVDCKALKLLLCALLLIVLVSNSALAQRKVFGRDANGRGNPFTLITQVKEAIARRKLNIVAPNNPIRRSYGGRYSGFKWGHNNTCNDGTFELTSLQHTCRVLGYRRYVSSTCHDSERSHRYGIGKGNFHSPHNNHLTRYSADFNGYKTIAASPKSQTWVATITCEVPLSQCEDGIDNDGDGRTDTQDPGCSNGGDNNEGDEPACQNNFDDDGDGLTDLSDPGCSNKNDNDETDPPKSACSDGIDNDGDGRKDFPQDPGCRNRNDNNEGDESACQNNFDDDGDGLIDLDDPGCANKNDNNEQDPPKRACSDGIDNDGDGRTDFPEDPGCRNRNDNNEGDESACQNNFDDDGDGLVDLDDPGCANKNDNNEKDPPKKACNDGKDNDGDGRTDYPEDPGCISPTDQSEGNEPDCQNNFDDDGDGLIDYPEDPGCSSPKDNNEKDPKTACNDGEDNDLDGRIDYPNDPGCSSAGDTNEGDEPACQNNLDDDGDGLIDLNDLGCDSPDDTDESDPAPRTACNDGIDNDGDNKVDLNDPGCDDLNDNDETDATPTINACNDGIDNDGDGVTDFAGGDHTIGYRYGSRDPQVGASWEIWNVRNTNDGAASEGSEGPVEGAWPAWEITDTSRTARNVAYSTPVDSYFRGLIETGSWEITAWVKVKGTHDDPLDGGQAIIYDDGQRAYGMLFGADKDGNQIVALPAALDASTGRYSDNGMRYISVGGNGYHEYVLRYDPRTQAAMLLVDGTVVLEANRWIGYPSDNLGPDIWWGANSVEGTGSALWSLTMFKMHSDQGDPGCTSYTDTSEADGTTECQDRIDNDNDGLMDDLDPHCEFPMDNDEDFGPHHCRDDIDNDGDGLVDFNDPGCWSSIDNDESGNAPPCSGFCGSYSIFGNDVDTCGDFHDNDGDGLIDDLDPGCQYGSSESQDVASAHCGGNSPRLKSDIDTQFDVIAQIAQDQLDPTSNAKQSTKNAVKRVDSVDEQFSRTVRQLPSALFDCEQSSTRASNALKCRVISTKKYKKTLSRLARKASRFSAKAAKSAGQKQQARDARASARSIRSLVKRIPNSGMNCY